MNLAVSKRRTWSGSFAPPLVSLPIPPEPPPRAPLQPRRFRCGDPAPAFPARRVEHGAATAARPAPWQLAVQGLRHVCRRGRGGAEGRGSQTDQGLEGGIIHGSESGCGGRGRQRSGRHADLGADELVERPHGADGNEGDEANGLQGFHARNCGFGAGRPSGSYGTFHRLPAWLPKACAPCAPGPLPRKGRGGKSP
jgi:hypothetical protein